jgi:hypothetical protein
MTTLGAFAATLFAYFVVRTLVWWITSKPASYVEPENEIWGDTSSYERRHREFNSWLHDERRGQ